MPLLQESGLADPGDVTHNFGRLLVNTTKSSKW